MFCKHCGTSLEEGVKFCGKCGGKNADAVALAESSFVIQEGFFERISTGRLGRRNYFFGLLYFT